MKYKERATVIVAGRPHDIRAHSKEEFLAKVKKWEARADNGDISRITVGKWRVLWAETYKRPAVSPDWYAEILRISNKLSDIDYLEVSKVKPIHLKAIINGEKGKAKSTAQKTRLVLKEIFKQAKDEGLIATDITTSLKLPETKEKQSRRPITQKERNAVLSVAKRHPQGTFFAIMLYAGLRPSEVRALRWKDVDLDNYEIKVTAAAKEGRRIGGTKSRAGVRVVPLNCDLIPYLRKGSPFEFVCPNRDGNMMTETNYKDAWGSFKRLLHIEMGGKLYRNQIKPPYVVAPDLTPYCFRHTYCTDLEKLGVPLNIAKALMGHSSIEITAKIYTHFDDETLEMAKEYINGPQGVAGKMSGKKS